MNKNNEGIGIDELKVNDTYLYNKLIDITNYYVPSADKKIKDTIVLGVMPYFLSHMTTGYLDIGVKTVNVLCTDDKIRSVVLQKSVKYELMMAADKFNNETATTEFYKNVLTRKENNKKHIVIGGKVVDSWDSRIKIVLQYIMENNLLPVIYDICILKEFYVDFGYKPIELMDAYIKYGTKLHNSKAILETEDNNDKLWELKYLNSKIGGVSKNIPRYLEFDYRDLACDLDIYYPLLVHRTGDLHMNADEAIKLGEKERDEYGLTDEGNTITLDGGSNISCGRILCNYIIYLDAKKRGIKPNFIFRRCTD